MFNALIARLKGAPKARPLPALDDRLAMAALLIRVAKADDHYAYEEIAAIDTILGRTHGLNQVEAAKLRADAERIEAAAPDTAAFVAELRAYIPYETRAALHRALWDVGLADSTLNPEEEAFLTEITAALGIAGGSDENG